MKPMEAIMLHLKLVRGVWGVLLAHVVRQHVKVKHILHGHDAYLNFDEEMIIQAWIVDKSSNLQKNKNWLDMKHVNIQCDTFNIDKAFKYHMLSKIVTDMDDLYIKQMKSSLGGQDILLDVHQQILCTDHVARKATEAGTKLQNSHGDGKKKGWDWDKHVTLHKELYTIMEGLVDHGYIGIEDGTKVCHFLQEIRNTELEAVVNLVWVQPQKYS